MAHMFVPEGQGSTLDKLKRPKKTQRVIKVLLPHVMLILLLFSYIATGAAIFRAIELPEEKIELELKLTELRRLYDKTVVEARVQCKKNLQEYSEWMTEMLNEISAAHTARYAPINPDDIVADEADLNPSTRIVRWSYSAAVLYALGVLTTTGYSYVQLSTTTGKVFAVIYGLIGFPLMFITAADIGKLMSEMVSYVYFNWVDRKKLIHDTSTALSEASALSDTNDNNGNSPLDGQTESEREAILNANQSKEPNSASSVELPAWAIFGATLCICIIGSFMYMQIEGWSFVDALYFAFNAVTNMTLGDIPVSGMLFAVITVFYVTFGLAVVTMSIDLAQNQLRSLFRKIHYFGRTIKNLRGRFMLELDEDVREMLRIITAVRKKHPNKAKVTENDIIDFLKQNLPDGASGPVVQVTPAPSRRSGKRKSIAFIPEGIGTIKFADEDKSGIFSPNSFETFGEVKVVDEEQSQDGQSGSDGIEGVQEVDPFESFDTTDADSKDLNYDGSQSSISTLAAANRTKTVQFLDEDEFADFPD